MKIDIEVDLGQTTAYCKSVLNRLGPDHVGQFLAGCCMVLISLSALLRLTGRVALSMDWHDYARHVEQLGPGGTMLMSFAGLVLLLLTVVVRVVEGRTIHPWQLGLWLIGGLSAAWATVGATWTGALALGLAVMMHGQYPRRRKIILAGLIALSIPLAMDGIDEAYILRPRAIRAYVERPNEVLQAHDIQPGSDDQRALEAQLYRYDPRGSFMHSNVLATALAGLLPLAMGAWILGWRAHRGPRRLLTAVVLICGAGLLLTLSRGAVLALMLSALVSVLGCWLTVRRRTANWFFWLALPAVALPAVLVVVWGSSGQDSALTDRYWSWVGALKLFFAHPWTGVRPGLFAEAFQQVREHSCALVPIDPAQMLLSWLSSLGIWALAWIGLMVIWTLQAARDARRDVLIRWDRESSQVDAATDDQPVHPDGLGVLILAILVILVSVPIDLPTMDLTRVIPWLFGQLGFIYAWYLLSTLSILERPLERMATFAGALVVVIHSQVEMGMADPNAAPLLMGILGLAASGCLPKARLRRAVDWLLPMVVAVPIVMAGVLSVRQMVGEFCLAGTVDQIGRLSDRTDSSDALDHQLARCGLLLNDGRPYAYRAGLRLDHARAAASRGQAVVSSRDLDAAWSVLVEARADLGDRLPLEQMQLRVAVSGHRLTGRSLWSDRIRSAIASLSARAPHDSQILYDCAEALWPLGELDRHAASRLYRRALQIDHAQGRGLKGLSASEYQKAARRSHWQPLIR